MRGRRSLREYWAVLRFYWPRLLITCLGWVANDFAVRRAGACLPSPLAVDATGTEWCGHALWAVAEPAPLGVHLVGRINT